MIGTLYLVGTPIGNLGDLSPRALEILQTVDFIACEDTRVTRKLLSHFAIKKPLMSYFAHNQREAGGRILQRLFGGESCALVTDAGMPCISDPGEDLVLQCSQSGIPVYSIPGPSAFVAALSLSGLPSQRFCFEGFLSTEKKPRRVHLDSLKTQESTMIFYEAPHKLQKTLEDMLDCWGNRPISISRELTKRFEETLHLTLEEAVAHYKTNPPRGEFVLVIGGAAPDESSGASLEQAMALYQELLASGLSKKDACRQAASITGVSKNLLYSESLK